MQPQNTVIVRTAEQPVSAIGERMGMMRSWLDRRGIELADFELALLGFGSVAFDRTLICFGRPSANSAPRSSSCRCTEVIHQAFSLNAPQPHTTTQSRMRHALPVRRGANALQLSGGNWQCEQAVERLRVPQRRGALRPAHCCPCGGSGIGLFDASTRDQQGDIDGVVSFPTRRQ
jgi:hypothetical protein